MDQSFQTDPRLKLPQYHIKIHVDIVALKCMLQQNAVEGIFFKLINQHNFPLQFHIKTPQHLEDYFPLFPKKLLDLNPTICKHPILSDTNPFFFFSHSRSIIKLLYQLLSCIYMILILFFTSKAENFYINSVLSLIWYLF